MKLRLVLLMVALLAIPTASAYQRAHGPVTLNVISVTGGTVLTWTPVQGAEYYVVWRGESLRDVVPIAQTTLFEHVDLSNADPNSVYVVTVEDAEPRTGTVQTARGSCISMSKTGVMITVVNCLNL